MSAFASTLILAPEWIKATMFHVKLTMPTTAASMANPRLQDSKTPVRQRIHVRSCDGWLARTNFEIGQMWDNIDRPPVGATRVRDYVLISTEAKAPRVTVMALRWRSRVG
jgi:hypothetical protein